MMPVKTKKADLPRLRYWGWGSQDHGYDPQKRDRLLAVLADSYGLKPNCRDVAPVPVEKWRVPQHRLDDGFIARWQSRGLSVNPVDRALHAAGKSYRDLVRVRAGALERYPDGVVRVNSENELGDLLRDASRFSITVVPFGGGTGVVGGVECVGDRDRPVIAVDMKKLCAFIALDEISMTATFQAGILGPELEKILNERGYTLGHFPQSFEFSTLGGWVATRSAGQNSTLYGKIEHMVQSLTVATPTGGLSTHEVPASATGPSLKELFLGSEGIYGIITRVTLRVHPVPERKRRICACFPDFSLGITLVRRVMQTGLKPAIVRLMDAPESALIFKSGMSPLVKFLSGLWLKWRGAGTSPCLLLLGCEGERERTDVETARIVFLIRQQSGALLPEGSAAEWERSRFTLPYLRDDLMDRGYFIDTLETAAPWSRIEPIHERLAAAFSTAAWREQLIVGAHLSHAYPDGASLYFTFIGCREPGKELKQWEKIKERATSVILKNGGALSHHHGIGYDHRRWMDKEVSPLGLEILRSVKSRLDPAGILNPGKVV